MLCPHCFAEIDPDAHVEEADWSTIYDGKQTEVSVLIACIDYTCPVCEGGIEFAPIAVQHPGEVGLDLVHWTIAP